MYKAVVQFNQFKNDAINAGLWFDMTMLYLT